MLNFSGQTGSTGTASISHHTNNNLYVRGGTSGLVLGNHDGTNIIHISNSNHISFETTDGTERLRIDSGGRIITGNYSTALDTTAGSIIVNGNTSGGRIATRGSGSSANTTLGEMFGFGIQIKLLDSNLLEEVIPQIKTDRLSSTPVLLVLLLLKDFV